MKCLSIIPVCLAASAIVLPATPAGAAVLESGTAILTLDEAAFAANSAIKKLDAWFGNAATRAETLSNPAPGDGFTLPDIEFRMNTGTFPPGVPGVSRNLQTTNLEFDPDNVLGTWTPSLDIGAFLGNQTSEQIGLEGMMRWTGDFTGVLLFGDFGIRYSAGRVGVVREGNTLSGLTLTSNIDFLNATFLDIANATITADATSFSIQGDLVISEGFGVLDASARLGADVGDFRFNGTVVPEPASLAVLGVGSLLFAGVMRRRLARRAGEA